MIFMLIFVSGIMKAFEMRENQMVEGASCHYVENESERRQSFGHSYIGQETVPRPVRSENLVPTLISNSPKYSYSPENSSPRAPKPPLALRQRPVAVSTPQIKESILPTGSIKIKSMIANENQPRIPAVNVTDNPNVSPVSNVYVDTSMKPRLRASDSDLFRLLEPENTHRNNSSSLSPPGLLTRQEDQRAYVNHGTKPKTVDKLGFPARMTQSEIIYGNVSSPRIGKRQEESPPRQSKRPEESSRSTGRTRSAFFPVPDMKFQPVKIPEENSTIDNEKSHYDNYHEPDYENVHENENTAKKTTEAARDSNRVIYENFGDYRTENSKRNDRTSNIRSNHGNFGFTRTSETRADCESDVNSLKICPSCNQEFSRLSIEQFQMHVYECFDSNEDQPTTLQAGQANVSQDDRTCPMCQETFPMTVPQETYEAHVLAHFGEVPTERFEIVGS